MAEIAAARYQNQCRALSARSELPQVANEAIMVVSKLATRYWSAISYTLLVVKLKNPMQRSAHHYFCQQILGIKIVQPPFES